MGSYLKMQDVHSELRLIYLLGSGTKIHFSQRLKSLNALPFCFKSNTSVAAAQKSSFQRYVKFKPTNP